ncbi:MAG: hypothetical protein IPO21_07515 [Bacteroidales bacterium]|nr:hypothetical protein [Bacteroidales bacterium]
MVCENSVQNAYYVQELEGDSTTFVWSISGNHTNYTISNEQNKAYRLVDWDYQGKEVVKVKVVNKYGCSSSDSMEVTIAVKPDAQFLWSLPGAAYKAKFENLSTQAPVYFNNATGGADSLEVTYNMSWDFGRLEDTLPYIVPYTQRNAAITQTYEYGPWDVKLKVTNDHGCVDSIVQSIFIEISVGLFVPKCLLLLPIRLP